jgi:adhesin transport system outer membrane protein
MQKRNTRAKKAGRRSRLRETAAGSRRPLLSASGAVFGAGVVALAFAPSRSEAASALDAMAWLPTEVPVTQPGAFVPAAPAPDAGAMSEGSVQSPVRVASGRSADAGAYPGPRLIATPVAVSAMNPDPQNARVPTVPAAETQFRSNASAPIRSATRAVSPTPSIGVTPQPIAGPVAAFPLSGDQANTPVLTTPRTARDAEARSQSNTNGRIDMANRPVAGWKLRSAGYPPPRQPAMEIAPIKVVDAELQPDPVSRDPASRDAARPSRSQGTEILGDAPAPLRVPTPDLHSTAAIVQPMQTPLLVPAPAHPLAGGPIPKADLMSAAQAPISALAHASASHANDVVLAFPDSSAPAKKRNQQRSARAIDEAYSQWLGDTAVGIRDLNAGPPVPEQAVRAALRHAAEIAAERSADVRQARADWQAAGFDTDVAKGARWPQLQLNGFSPSIKDSNNQFNDYNRAYVNLNMSTTVYDWGKNSKTIESRSKTATAAEYKYIATAQQNAYDIATNLVELAKNRAAFDIGVNYVKRMSALVDMLAEIVKVDAGRSSELTQAKARLLQAQTSQEQVATRVHELELAVRKLVGNEPTPLPHGTRWQLHVMGVEDAVAAIDQNPTVAQAAAEQDAANAYAKAVRASGLPQVNWVVTKSTGRDTFGQRQPWATMLQLSWTPFQGGSQQASERAARARADSSGDKKEQLRLDAEYNVRQAHHDALALSERARLYGEVADESELVRKQFFEQWYHLNRRTLLDVLLAESDFYNNQVAEVTNQFDSYQSVLKLHLSSGTLMQWLGETS